MHNHLTETVARPHRYLLFGSWLAENDDIYGKLTRRKNSSPPRWCWAQPDRAPGTASEHGPRPDRYPGCATLLLASPPRGERDDPDDPEIQADRLVDLFCGGMDAPDAVVERVVRGRQHRHSHDFGRDRRRPVVLGHAPIWAAAHERLAGAAGVPVAQLDSSSGFLIRRSQVRILPGTPISRTATRLPAPVLA